MRIAVKIACLSHREMNDLSILDNVRIVPSDVESLLVKSGWAISRTCEKKEQKRAAFTATPSVKGWFHELNLPSSGPQILKSPVITPRASGQRKPQSFTKAPQGRIGLKMDVDDNQVAGTRLYVHNVITALARNHTCNNCSFREEILLNADSRQPVRLRSLYSV